MFTTLFIYKVTFTFVRCADLLFRCCIVMCVKTILDGVFIFWTKGSSFSSQNIA